jgi:hypothetical protein
MPLQKLVAAIRASRVGQAAAGAGVTGAGINAAIKTGVVATGATLAFQSARDLYSSRSAMANNFQQQTTFPSDLIGNDSRTSFYMSFKFQAYEKRAINNAPFLRSEGTIRLPIPDNLRDNMSVTYGSKSFEGAEGLAVGAGLESLAGTRPTSEQNFAGVSSDLAGRGTKAITAATQGAAIGALNQGLPNLSSAAQAYFGTAVNPYQTVLFEKPDFKSHSFSWKFMPRDEQESAAARDIFRTFQFHMLPGVSEGIGLFFSYPSMVVISLYPSSEFLYRFKPCVIKSVSVNYAAGSTPSFFKRSGAPTAMTFTIDLQEIEYWTNKDYMGQTAFNDDFAMSEMRNRIARNNPQQASDQPRGPGVG